MDGVTYKKQGDKVIAILRRYLRKWQPRLLAGEKWSIHASYVWTDWPHGGAIGHTSFRWCYRNATIAFDLGKLVDVLANDPLEMEELVVHELSHVLLAELHPDYAQSSQEQRDLLELVTTRVTRTFLAAAGWSWSWRHRGKPKKATRKRRARKASK